MDRFDSCWLDSEPELNVSLEAPDPVSKLAANGLPTREEEKV